MQEITFGRAFQQQFFARYPGLQPLMELFEHVPEVCFYAKDRKSRFVRLNRANLAVYGVNDEESLLGTLRPRLPSALARRRLHRRRSARDGKRPGAESNLAGAVPERPDAMVRFEQDAAAGAARRMHRDLRRDVSNCHAEGAARALSTAGPGHSLSGGAFPRPHSTCLTSPTTATYRPRTFIACFSACCGCRRPSICSRFGCRRPAACWRRPMSRCRKSR